MRVVSVALAAAGPEVAHAAPRRPRRPQDRVGLDERWRVLPAGGAQNIPALVALLGGHLDVTVLVDAGTQGMQRLTNLASRGLLDQRRLVTVAKITATNQADIEDVFSRGLSEALQRRLRAPSEEDKCQRGIVCVKRIAGLDKGEDFDHGIPADHLVRNRTRRALGSPTRRSNAFERLFERLNSKLVDICPMAAEPEATVRLN